MKLLRCIADKLYKYSSYAKKEIKAPFLITQTPMGIEKINCEVSLPESMSIEDVKKVMARTMVKDISQFINIKSYCEGEYYFDKKYIGELKVIKEQRYD